MEGNSERVQPDDGVDSEDIVEGGIAPGDAEEIGIEETESAPVKDDDPYRIKKRLGVQAKKHEREMRAMEDRLRQMQDMIQQSQSNQNIGADTNHFSSPGQPNEPSMSEDERIQAAVRYALGMKDHEEAQAKQAEAKAHIAKQYQRLHGEFDKFADKYDDFEDKVRGDDVPFTPHMRDALLLVENPGEVAYHLGKNRPDLERISKLLPLEQAREVNRMAFALLSGKGDKSPNVSSAKNSLMGAIKPNPASSRAITDKTPASEIRARMKAGTWK